MSFAPEYGITEIPGLYYFQGYTFEPVTASLVPMVVALTVAFLITWVACMVWSD